MDKNEIERELKKKFPDNRVRLPRDMGFSVDSNGVLRIGMTPEGLQENMQDNAAAFEGWVLCLKAAMPGDIKTIQIDWNLQNKLSNVALHHYNRFLYRLQKFVANYGNVESSQIKSNICTTDWVVNYPEGESAKKATKIESKMEREFIKNFSSEYDVIDEQLPIGVFLKPKSKKTL